MMQSSKGTSPGTSFGLMMSSGRNDIGCLISQRYKGQAKLLRKCTISISVYNNDLGFGVIHSDDWLVGVFNNDGGCWHISRPSLGWVIGSNLWRDRCVVFITDNTTV